MTGTIQFLRQIAAETPDQIQAAKVAFIKERVMPTDTAIATKPVEQSWPDYVLDRAAQEARNAAYCRGVQNAPRLYDDAPMTTNAPEPISQPGFGHVLMMPVWFFAIIGAWVTGIWLMKAAENVARAMGAI